MPINHRRFAEQKVNLIVPSLLPVYRLSGIAAAKPPGKSAVIVEHSPNVTQITGYRLNKRVYLIVNSLIKIMTK
jgi:hypothetical protein